MLKFRIGYTCTNNNCRRQEWCYFAHIDNSRALGKALLQQGWRQHLGLWWCPAHHLDYVDFLLEKFIENSDIERSLD